MNEPLWVAGISGGQHGGPRLEDCRGLASVHDGRRQKRDTPVPVLLVMPVKKPPAEVEAVVVTGEAVWKVGPVLQCLELALLEGQCNILSVNRLCVPDRGELASRGKEHKGGAS